MNLPKILIATLQREHGDTGVQTHVNTLADALRARRQAFELVTPYGADAWGFYPWYGLRFPIQRLHRPSGVRWYRHSRWWALRWRLWRRLRDGAPAILYAQCPVSAAAALHARVNERQRIVLAVHFNISQADEWVGQGMIGHQDATWRSIRAFEARVLPRLDGLLFVSRFMQAQVAERIAAIAAVPQVVLPNFVADPLPAGGAPVAGLDRPLRLVAIGTLEPRKNQAYLLDVLDQALRRGARLHLTLIGDGPDRKALEERVQALKLAQVVEFAGRVANAGATLGGYDACIHTARIENLPLTLIEAMAHGLPLFACPVGGIPDVFSDGVEGRYLPLDDAPAAAQLLADAAADPQRWGALGARSRQRFLQGFEQQAVVAQLLAFMANVDRQPLLSGG